MSIKIERSLMENRIDGVVLLGFALCFKLFWHATPVPLVEIHYYLSVNPVDVSSEKNLVLH